LSTTYLKGEISGDIKIKISEMKNPQ